MPGCLPHAPDCHRDHPLPAAGRSGTWVDWFNTRRLLGPLGNIPPAEFEAQYYARPRWPDSTNSVSDDPGTVQFVFTCVMKGRMAGENRTGRVQRIWLGGPGNLRPTPFRRGPRTATRHRRLPRPGGRRGPRARGRAGAAGTQAPCQAELTGEKLRNLRDDVGRPAGAPAQPPGAVGIRPIALSLPQRGRETSSADSRGSATSSLASTKLDIMFLVFLHFAFPCYPCCTSQWGSPEVS